jgi:uncharacterized metal-binding protein
MENKQTAVEWLSEQLKPSIALQTKYIDEFIEYAKQMEEKQIADAYCVGVNENPKYKLGEKIDWENYYERNYGKQT